MGMADDYFLLVCDDVPHDVVLTGPGIRVLDVAQVVRRADRPESLAEQSPGDAGSRSDPRRRTSGRR